MAHKTCLQIPICIWAIKVFSDCNISWTLATNYKQIYNTSNIKTYPCGRSKTHRPPRCNFGKCKYIFLQNSLFFNSYEKGQVFQPITGRTTLLSVAWTFVIFPNTENEKKSINLSPRLNILTQKTQYLREKFGLSVDHEWKRYTLTDKLPIKTWDLTWTCHHQALETLLTCSDRLALIDFDLRLYLDCSLWTFTWCLTWPCLTLLWL